MSAPAARLPYTLVGSTPVVYHVVAKADEHLLHLAIEMATVIRVLRGGVNHLTIDIELKLITRAIADTNRLRSAVTGEILEFSLLRRLFAIHRVKHAKFRLGETRGLQQPGNEPVGFGVIAEFQQCAHGKR